MKQEIIKTFGNRVRIRVCGICRNDDKILMVNHKSLTANNFWAPPGGGVEFSKTLAQTLKEEFMQETGLNIIPGKFLFGCEFINHPLHAIELFFDVSIRGGTLKTGTDPELSTTEQIISEVRFFTSDELEAIPMDQKHGIFKLYPKTKQLDRLHGFYII